MARPCRFCGSSDVPPQRAAQSHYCCPRCATIKARERRERRGVAKPRLVSLPGEIWRVIPGYAQAYQVSNLGRIRNALGREMKLKAPGKFPYPTVALVLPGGGKKAKAVHRLVGDAFLGPRPPGHVTRHLNGDTTDNRAWVNLVWGTPLENCQDTARHGRLPRGERHCCAILTDEIVATIRRRQWAGASASALAREYGVHPRTIRDAVAGVTWKHLSMEDAPCVQA